MSAARFLAKCLIQPELLLELDEFTITAVITCARAEKLLATLAHQSAHLSLHRGIRAIFDDALQECETVHRSAMWEVDRMQQALKGLNIAIVLLKGAAFVAAELRVAKGRQVGDLDILVPREALPEVETALIAAGWEWVKDDPYDQEYYRKWMHELPPLIHKERDGMIDVHHTILPLTAKPTPDSGSLIADARKIRDGLAILNTHDLICHAAAHFAADGDMAGGMRNLWDVHILITEFAVEKEFWTTLAERAAHHQLTSPVARTLRLSHQLYGTELGGSFIPKLSLMDRLFLKRLLARDGWGRERYPVVRFFVYVRSHWLRMPPLMLARHLLIKWRKGNQS